MKIVIDPGHSGPREPGACAGGIREADVVFAIASTTIKMLAAQNYEVILTRTGDIEDDGLAWRSELANEWGADLFVSVHANSAEAVEAHGTECWYYPGSEQGLALATQIQRSVSMILQTKDRGVKTAHYDVLAATACPAVLVETAFLSNAAERELLLKRTDGFGRAIAYGIMEHIRLIS